MWIEEWTVPSVFGDPPQSQAPGSHLERRGYVGTLECKYAGKTSLDPYLTPYLHINSKGVIDLHGKPKAIKPLGRSLELEVGAAINCRWARGTFWGQ